MKHEIDLKNYSIHTDLIIESIAHCKDLKGIKQESHVINGIVVDEVEITKEGGALVGKKPGIYRTIRFEDVTDKQNRQAVSAVFEETLQALLTQLHISKDARCVVIGLGNRDSTPDALGPKVIDSVLVTKHLFDMPGSNVESGYRNVAAFTPGVTGTTGIETSDVILGIISRVKPDFVIVIDALASSSIERVNKTIQMTDTGVHPGSGVGNSRSEISQETIGIPVIAIGIPTVVDAVTIVSDTIHYMLQQFSYNKDNFHNHKTKLVPSINRNYLEHDKELSPEEKKTFIGLLGSLSDDEMKQLIFEVLTPIGYNMMVTPKEIDFMIEKLAVMLAQGMNRVLHEKYTS